MSESTRDFKIGITTLGGLAALTAVLFSFGELDSLFRDSYSVDVRANRGGGLREGSQVTINGVAIGTVDTITLDASSTDPVLIRLSIDQTATIPAAATPTANASLLGGGAMLDFVIPPEGAGDAAIPKDGTGVVRATFRGIEERVMDVVDGAFGHLDETLQSFSRLATDLDTLVAPVEPDSPAAESNLRTSVTRLNRMLASADLAFKSAGDLLSDEQLQADVRSAVWKANTLIDEATTAMRALSGVAGTVDLRAKELEPVLTAMRSTLERVDAMTKAASEGKGTVGQLLTNPDLYTSLEDSAHRLRSTLSEMELLLRKIREEGLDISF